MVIFHSYVNFYQRVPVVESRVINRVCRRWPFNMAQLKASGWAKGRVLVLTHGMVGG